MNIERKGNEHFPSIAQAACCKHAPFGTAPRNPTPTLHRAGASDSIHAASTTRRTLPARSDPAPDRGPRLCSTRALTILSSAARTTTAVRAEVCRGQPKFRDASLVVWTASNGTRLARNARLEARAGEGWGRKSVHVEREGGYGECGREACPWPRIARTDSVRRGIRGQGLRHRGGVLRRPSGTPRCRVLDSIGDTSSVGLCCACRFHSHFLTMSVKNLTSSHQQTVSKRPKP